jgi:hypothetical protein
LLIAALISALVGAAAAQHFGSPFSIPRSVTAGIGVVATPEQAATVGAAKRVRDANNTCATFAIVGMMMGLVYGVVVGVASLTLRRIVTGFVCGTLAGAICGFIAGYLTTPASQVLASSLDSEERTIAVNSLAWGITALGSVFGTLFALPSRRALIPCLLAGFAGSLAGGLLYVPVISLSFPDVDTELIIPDSLVAKCVWIGLPALGFSLGMVRALIPRAN